MLNLPACSLRANTWSADTWLGVWTPGLKAAAGGDHTNIVSLTHTQNRATHIKIVAVAKDGARDNSCCGSAADKPTHTCSKIKCTTSQLLAQRQPASQQTNQHPACTLMIHILPKAACRAWLSATKVSGLIWYCPQRNLPHRNPHTLV